MFCNLQSISKDIKAVKAAQTVTGDISRRKKVKEKRPSPFLIPLKARNKSVLAF